MTEKPANIRNYEKLKKDAPFVKSTKRAAYLEIMAKIRFNAYSNPINFDAR